MVDVYHLMQRPNTRKPIDMRISPDGVANIQRREGLRLEAYDDGTGTRTIGYGHTGGVKPDEHITKSEAFDLLMADLDRVHACLSVYVQQPLLQREYDALASFVFNIGTFAFEGSTVRRKLNEGNPELAAYLMLGWCKAGGKRIKGLYLRRLDEAGQFLGMKPGEVQKHSAV